VSLEIEVLPDEDWPALVGRRLTEAIAHDPKGRICLATGNTIAPVYRHTEVVGDPSIFLLDEFGGLPRDDPARCAAMFRRDLAHPRFLAPDVDAADPHAAADRYGETVRQRPLHLAVVGLGRNGHVGMNEPGSTMASITRKVELSESTSLGALEYGASIRPAWGITVGIAELMGAMQLWLLVTGAHKAEILADVMRCPIGSELPAGYLREHHNARLLADTAAARLL
jgi:6-phosphogluconolactonase/glucosamine-6-phosphate isomerase/deaminase